MTESLYASIGKYICYIGTFGLVSLILIGVFLLVNRMIWALIGCFGGMNTFWRYAKWYHSEEKRRAVDKLQSRVQTQERI